MQRHGSLFLAVAFSLVAVSPFGSPCHADRLVRSVLAAGGVFEASSESYRLSSVLGQAAIGPCASEGYVMSCGFWSVPRTTTEAPAEQAQAPRAFRLLGTFPNPTTSKAAIVFELPAAAPVEVRIFDIGGRLTRVLFEGRREIGRHSIAWDGRNDAGTPVATGIYMILVRAGTDQSLSKLILLR
jgi:hypothetical protein